MPEEPRPYREFSRAELHQLVWSQPLRTIARGLKISDVGLAKVCRHAGIPVPERGYWAKKQASKPTSLRPLPPRFPGASDTVSLGVKPYHYYGSTYRLHILATGVPAEPTFDEDMASVAERVRKMVGSVKCHNNFDSPHRCIAQLLAQDDERRSSFRASGVSVFAPKYQSGVERRRLLILNALFNALQRLSCSPEMSTSKYTADAAESRVSRVKIGHQWLRFTLEPAKVRPPKEKGRPPRQPLRLSLLANGGREACRVWEDEDGNGLEGQLTAIVVAMLAEGEEAHRRSVRRSREHLISEKARVEAEIVAEKQEAERARCEAMERALRARIDGLLSQANDFRNAETIRAYVRTARDRAQQSIPSLEQWADWAAAEADRIDPTKNSTLAAAAAAVVNGGDIEEGDSEDADDAGSR